jgi:CheY-like chemotaxis protein
VRALAREICRLHGYHVLDASGPAAALRLWEREGARVRLLVTDVVMPGMSGRELAGRLTAERRDLKVLYISGYTADVLGAHGVLESGIALVEKPFTPHTLCGKVREVLDQGAA